MSSKSLEDLQLTITDLSRKLTFAARMGNQPMVNQIQMAMESYRSEYSKKMDAMMSTKNIQNSINIQKES